MMQTCPECGSLAPYSKSGRVNRCNSCGWDSGEKSRDQGKRERMDTRRQARRRKNEQEGY